MAKKKILVIEDEAELANAIKTRLSLSGYEVTTANDGAQGLDKIKSERPDLVILDLMLPKMDGHKICGLVKRDTRYSKIGIIILTAKAQEEDMRQAKELGADAYITKPFESRILLAKIKELLGEA